MNHNPGWVALFAASAVLLMVSTEPLADDATSYEQLADAIVWTPDSSIKPAPATLAAGELACPSIRAVGINMACAAHLTATNNATDAGVEECKRVRKNLGCSQTEENELITLVTVYTMTIPDQEPRPRTLARVRGENGEERYVFYEALKF